MSNTIYNSEGVNFGKASPAFQYIFDAYSGNPVTGWRPVTPCDFVAKAQTFSDPNLSGEMISVSCFATSLVGFFTDYDGTDEPLYLQFFSNPITGGPPKLTYPLYAHSSMDQQFTYPIDGFQGIIAQITTDKEALIPWNGDSGTGILSNFYFRE
jgi:hypothetical protein